MVLREKFDIHRVMANEDKVGGYQYHRELPNSPSDPVKSMMQRMRMGDKTKRKKVGMINLFAGREVKTALKGNAMMFGLSIGLLGAGTGICMWLASGETDRNILALPPIDDD